MILTNCWSLLTKGFNFRNKISNLQSLNCHLSVENDSDLNQNSCLLSLYLFYNNPDIYFVSRSTPKILGLGLEKVPLALPLLTSSVEITHIRYTHHEAGDGTSKRDLN